MRELIDVQENAQENMLRGNLQDKSQEDAVEKKVDFSCNCSWDKDGEGGGYDQRYMQGRTCKKKLVSLLKWKILNFYGG